MRELDATHYDRVFASSKEYRLSATAAPWAPLWRWLASRIRARENVVDFGCGPGHLAELLQASGHDQARYLGVDFSAEAISQARVRVPGFSFVQQDVLQAARDQRAKPGFTAVLCEVLEHIEADLVLLQELPKRTRVLATVPTFDTVGHVRHFTSIAEVALRYEAVVEITHIVRVGRSFGFAGVRP